MPRTGKELFVGWRVTFGKCKSGVIWGAVPFYYVYYLSVEE